MRVVQAIFWFHPFIWLAERRIQFIRERACDDFAIHALESSKDYGEVLLAIASGLSERRRLGFGLAVMRTPKIAARIEATVDSEGSPICHLSFRGRLAILMATLFIAGTLAGASIVEAHHPEKQPEANSARKTPAEETRGFVRGEVVLEADDTPVVGATVLLRAGRLRRATTDDLGRFQFDDIRQGHHHIWAFKEPLASPKQPIIGQESGTNVKPMFSPVRLAMSTGKQIKVTVTSAITGQPIELAKVELGYPDRRSKLTAKDGTAVLEALLPEPYSMTIQATGHARAIRELDFTSADPVISASVSLALGGTIRGLVTDENQIPVAKADVVFRYPESPAGFYGESPYSDERGQYRSLYLPLHTPIRVSVGLKDYLRHDQEVTLTEEQRDLDLNFLLKKRPVGGSIRGIVTDDEGKPIASASVVNFGDREDEKRETTTDELGRFTLRDVVKTFAGHELVARAPGFAPMRQKFDPMAAEDSPAISIKLEKGHSVRGRVQNTSGQPIPGAFVEVNGGDSYGQTGEYVRTDRDGYFGSDSLPLKSKFQIYAAGYSTIDEISLALDRDEVVKVTLEPAGAIRGRVVDLATGKAITQFRVRLSFSNDFRPGDVRSSYSSDLREVGLTFHPKDGSFAINELTSGMPFQVVVDADGYEQAILPRVVAQTDAAINAVTISLKTREPLNPASLSGIFLDDKGNPVSGIQVRLIVVDTPADVDNDGRFNWVLIDSGQLAGKDYIDQYIAAVTNDEGKFELKKILPGKFLQLAYWGERAPKGRSLALAKTKPSTSQSITIQLPEPATIRGSFDHSAFANASRMRLSLQDQSFHSYDYMLPDGKSDFEFRNLPSGQYWLSVIGQPERNKDRPQSFTLRPLASRLLTVEPGETLEVHFTKDD